MGTAITYDEPKGAITRAYPDLSKKLQRIARFALEVPHGSALGTVAAVAEATEVQPSAAIRFANAQGFNGFSEMQQIFRDHLVERSAIYFERFGLFQGERHTGQRAPAGVLHQVVDDAVGDLEDLEEHIYEADLKAAVKLIASAKHIRVRAPALAMSTGHHLVEKKPSNP